MHGSLPCIVLQLGVVTIYFKLCVYVNNRNENHESVPSVVLHVSVHVIQPNTLRRSRQPRLLLIVNSIKSTILIQNIYNDNVLDIIKYF